MPVLFISFYTNSSFFYTFYSSLIIVSSLTLSLNRFFSITTSILAKIVPSSTYFSIAYSFFYSLVTKSSLLLSASARPLSFPSIYIILNLYSPSISAYRTYRLLSTFIVVKYSKFLWSESIVSSKQLYM